MFKKCVYLNKSAQNSLTVVTHQGYDLRIVITNTLIMKKFEILRELQNVAQRHAIIAVGKLTLWSLLCVRLPQTFSL